jgi:hypothetical protein
MLKNVDGGNAEPAQEERGQRREEGGRKMPRKRGKCDSRSTDELDQVIALTKNARNEETGEGGDGNEGEVGEERRAGKVGKTSREGCWGGKLVLVEGGRREREGGSPKIPEKMAPQE